MLVDTWRLLQPLLVLLPMVPPQDDVVKLAAQEQVIDEDEGIPSRESSRMSRASRHSHRSRGTSRSSRASADETPSRSSLERPLLGHR